MNNIVWQKSSRSGNGANCVEVAVLPDHVMVRDSKDPEGPRLCITRSDWRAFVAGVDNDDFTP